MLTHPKYPERASYMVELGKLMPKPHTFSSVSYCQLFKGQLPCLSAGK